MFISLIAPKSLQKDVVIPLTSILESKHDGLAAAQVLSALGHADMSDRVRILVLSTNAPSVLMNMLGDDGGSAAAVKALAAILHAGSFFAVWVATCPFNRTAFR